MASIAESSVGSLPLAELARLQAQILQGSAGRVQPQANLGRDGKTTKAAASIDEYEQRITADDETHVDSERNTVNGEGVIAESANAYRTPISSPRTDAVKVPRLESAKSAPQAEMEAMVNPSPSQEALRDWTRATSFPPGDFEGGDTQPLGTQVWEEWESLKKSKTDNATTPKKEKMLLQISPNGQVQYTYDTNTTDRTPRTLQEGDMGFIDLQNALPEPASPTAGSLSDLGDITDDEGPVEQLPAQDAVFRKPAMPETPSIAGHKRRRSGELLTSETSAKKTPGFSQLFGFKAQKGDMMTGTQLYEQTQDPSSPMADVPRSDPALTRPSPNMQNNLTVSSPPMMMSSPIYNRAPPATAGEPRERYTSLRESQERKRAKLAADFDLKRYSDQYSYQDDDDDDTQRRRFSNQRLKRANSDQALHELRSVGVRPRPTSRPATSSSPHKTAMIDLRTPATTRKGADFDFDLEISDDDGEAGEEGLEEDEAAIADVPNHDLVDDDQQSENDVYDELAQIVHRSQGPGPKDDEDEAEREEAHDDDMADEMTDEVEQEAPPHMLVQGSSQQDVSDGKRRSQTATQRSAIADSQPLRNMGQQPSAPPRGDDRSPSCSYVPGSQYAGKTSQDQASLPSRQVHRSMGPPALSTSKSEDAGQQVVPSSPPLDVTNNIFVDFTAEASLERRKMMAQFQAEEPGTEQPTEQEIPESDLPATDRASSRPTTAEDRPNTESNHAPFSTARSHLSATGPSLSQGAPPPSPFKAFASQHSKVSSQSPRTKAGVRRFADIAGPTVAPAGSGETMADIDAVMSDIMNAEDQEFLAATSSPPRERPQKRRRTVGKPSIRSSSPVKEVHAEPAKPSPVAQNVDVDVQEAEDHTDLQPPAQPDELEARVLRNSPNKANERRVASPPPESTPESVKQREQAGARAASQLLSKRSSKVTKPAKLSNSSRKAGSKLQNGTTVRDAAASPKNKPRGRRASNMKNAQPTEQVVSEAVSAVDGATEPEIEETVIETHEEVPGVDQQPENEVVLAPHRVFALFKGTFNMFYPATWLGASSGGGHRAKFDDGTVTSIEPHLVGRLDLMLGDQVKVNYQGMKNKVWIIKGFGPALSSEKAQQALTDMHGHETIKIQAKSRNSISGPHAVAQGEGEIVNVALEIIYLTHSMWANFSGREFMPGAAPGPTKRLETPSTGVQTPADVETPTSRSRRATTSTAKAIEKRGSSLRDESTSAVRTPSSGLFHGMAFAVSYGQNECEKVNVTRLIQRNGGTILDDGFESMFNAPNLDEAETNSPSKKSTKKMLTTSNEQSGLQLKAEHKDLAFVALIADKHSRRAKYIQALALGIPTLSGRWIMDSLDASKNGSLSTVNAMSLPWTKYLLAAGESSYLNGAIRSRDLATYDAATAKLNDTVTNRPLLLNGEGVLIVASKKSKAVWERRKAFAFLTLALGAGHVKRVSDLQEAKTFLANEHEKWKFVYVDGSVADASAALFGKGAGATTAGNKKRKREDIPASKLDAKALSASDGDVRVVNDEFVVQSLILGALVD